MRFIPIALVAFVGLAACELPPIDQNEPRVALTGSDLENRLSGKRLTLVPVEVDNIDVPGVVTVLLYENGTTDLIVANDTMRMNWSIEGQGLCFVGPVARAASEDCRTIGWVQGDRFAVFDATQSPPLKIADGAISDLRG